MLRKTLITVHYICWKEICLILKCEFIWNTSKVDIWCHAALNNSNISSRILREIQLKQMFVTAASAVELYEGCKASCCRRAVALDSSHCTGVSREKQTSKLMCCCIVSCAQQKCCLCLNKQAPTHKTLNSPLRFAQIICTETSPVYSDICSCRGKTV